VVEFDQGGGIGHANGYRGRAEQRIILTELHRDAVMWRTSVLMMVGVILLTACGQISPAATTDRGNWLDLRASAIITDWPLPIQQPGTAWPGLALAPDGRLLLSWTNVQPGRRNVLQFSAYSPARKYWLNPPTTIAVGNRLRIDWATIPHLDTSHDGALWAQWVQTTDSGDEVMISRSRDGGANWSVPQTPHNATDINMDSGLASLWPNGETGIGIAWLAVTESTTTSPAIFLHTASIDATGQSATDAMLDLRACSGARAALTARGPLLAWCRRVADDANDIVLARRDVGGWTTPVQVHAEARCLDINDCLIGTSPALAVHGEIAVIAWSDADNGQRVIRMVRSTDAGKTFAKPVEIARGSRSLTPVAAALDAQQAWVLWAQVDADKGWMQSLWFARRSADLRDEYERREIAQTPDSVIGSGDTQVYQYMDFASFVLSEGTGYLVWTEYSDTGTTLRGVTIQPGAAAEP